MLRYVKILLFFSLFCLSEVYSQTDPDTNFQFSEKSLKLSELLNEISHQSPFDFSYNPRKIPVDTLILLPDVNMSFSGILSLLDFYQIESEILEDHIILKQKEKIAEVRERKFYTLSGHIYDDSNGEALIGAAIVLTGSGKGTTSNGYGFFSLKMEEGDNELLVSYIGYSPVKFMIDLEKDEQISKTLKKQTTEIEEVTIISDELERIGTLMQKEKVELPVNSIRKMPGFLGETDVIKSLQSVPGITFYSDGSTIFHVRGGARDQNLLLIDEAPVYNPAHLLGIFSVFTPDALNSVDIYKGDMPARYGGRLASVIDVKMKEGNRNEFTFSGNTGPVATTLNFEAPLLKRKGSFYLSGRRSHLKWILGNNTPNLEKLYFTDFNLKTNFRVNEKNRIFFSLFSGVDKFQNRESRLQSSGISWLNFAGNIRWNSIINNSLFVNTSIILSQYDYNLFISYELNNRWNTQIGLNAIKSDFTWNINPESTLKWGLFLGSHRYFPGKYLSGNKNAPQLPGVSDRYSSETALYLSFIQKFGERSSMSYGLRLVGWRNNAPGVEYIYDEQDNVTDTLNYASGSYHRMGSLEPRLNYSLRITDYIQAKLSLGRNVQYEHLISNSISPFTSLEVWLPAGPNLKPMISDQASVGLNWKSKRHFIYFNAEVFIKKMTNYIAYDDHAYMLFNPHVDREIKYGIARAAGAEFVLKKSRGKWDGWINYAYSRAIAKVAEINNGEEFPSRYDRPHSFSANIFYQAKPRLKLSASWIFMTGAPFTTPTAYYYYNGYQVPYYDKRNNDRLPDYDRLDIACDIRLNKIESEKSHNLKISFFNFYGKKNPFTINFNKIIDENGNVKVPADYSASPEYVPTMMYIYGIVPSVSYHFKF
jgi:hypothetical protein